jgi:hypothetical protein
MTKREYYDLLLRSAADGTFPGVRRLPDGRVRCMHRTPDGRACAVGVLIPPASYLPLIDEVEPGFLPVEALGECGVRPPDGVTSQDLNEIQAHHDFLRYCWDSAEFQRQILLVSCFYEFRPAPESAP